MAQKLRNKKN